MNKTLYFSIILLVTLIMLALYFLGVLDDVFNATKPKEINHETYNIDSVKFDGEKTFWTDGRSVLFETDNGSFVYPEKDVSYYEVKDDELHISITEFDSASPNVKLYMGEDDVKEIRTMYSEQFKENIDIIQKEEGVVNE